MKLSVITPVWNRQDCILACLESIGTQKCHDIEVEHVVVDDGSTDGTTDIIRRYAESHPHVKSIYFEKNRGTNAGRNAAIAAATGEYVIILDSDDVMLEGALAAIGHTIKTHPEYNYFMFACDDMDYSFCAPGQEVVISYEDMLVGKYFGDFVHAMPRKTVAEYPFDESLRIYEGIFFLRFYRAVGKMLFTNKVMNHSDRGRADHVTNTLHKVRNEVLRKDCQRIELLDEWFGGDLSKTAAGRSRLIDNLMISYQNHLLLGEYAGAARAAERISEVAPDRKIPFVYRAAFALRAGKPLWFLIKNMVKLKHKIRN